MFSKRITTHASLLESQEYKHLTIIQLYFMSTHICYPFRNFTIHYHAFEMRYCLSLYYFMLLEKIEEISQKPGGKLVADAHDQPGQW